MVHNKYMRWRRQHIWLLLISLISLAGLGALVMFAPPTMFNVTLIPLFLLLLFLTIFSLISLISKNMRWGILGAFLVTTFLLFRAVELTSPIYIAVFLFGIILFELSFRK